MARKSRKETVVLPAPEIDTSCRAGVYVRLSVEDKHTHTASIETQQLIIARYLEQNPEIIVVQTYIDNGATGTNFHRPGFQQMLSDIEAGLINCVIVKDLSRLGRNVIDTGYYIERYFPMQKVRFIAVNDRYDSSSPDNAHDGIIIPLRNMINEAYAMDIARKIKAQQRQAMKDGKYVGGRTPYGYLKAPDDCHQLIVDPVAAEVVKTMFQWAAEGAGLNTIAVRLNEAGYLSPSHYKRTLGEITHENLVGNGHWQTRLPKFSAQRFIPEIWCKGYLKSSTTSRSEPAPMNGQRYAAPMKPSSAGRCLPPFRKHWTRLHSRQKTGRYIPGLLIF